MDDRIPEMLRWAAVCFFFFSQPAEASTDSLQVALPRAVNIIQVGGAAITSDPQTTWLMRSSSLRLWCIFRVSVRYYSLPLLGVHSGCMTRPPPFLEAKNKVRLSGLPPNFSISRTKLKHHM